MALGRQSPRSYAPFTDEHLRRYDKYALTFLGGLTLAAAITYYRVRN